MNSYLHIAAEYEPNCEWPIKQMLLLVLGSSPFLKNKFNQLPENFTKNISLYRAGNKRLFEHKATIDITDDSSRNIIHYLMNQPSCRLFLLLLKRYPRLPINDPDSAQKTPFYFLFSDIKEITPEHVKMAELLLEHQANVMEHGPLDNKKNSFWHHAFKNKMKLLLPMTVRLLNKYFNEQIDQLNEEGLMPVNYLLEKFNYRMLFNGNSNNFWAPTEIISVFEIIMKRNNSEIFIAIIDKLTLSLYQDILKLVKVFLTKQADEEFFKIKELINCFNALEVFSYKDDKIKEIIDEIRPYIDNLESAIEKLEIKKWTVSGTNFNVKNKGQSSSSVYDPTVILPSCLMEEEKDLTPMSRFSVSLPASYLPSIPSNHLIAAVTFIEIDIDVKDPDFDYQKIPLTKVELKQSHKPTNLDIKEDQKISSRGKEKSEPSVQLGKKARYKIGMWGEQCVYEKLKSHDYVKYNGIKHKDSLQEKDKGFTLNGEDSRGLLIKVEFIWNNKWPKECKNPDERWEKHESRKPYDMCVRKTQACEIYLFRKLPNLSDSKAIAYRSCYLLTQIAPYQIVYINPKGSVKLIKITDVEKYRHLVTHSDLKEGVPLRDQLESDSLFQYVSFIPNQITDMLTAANGSIVKERIIEVKSTRSETPHSTFIPESEVAIMRRYRERYSIYRVFGATQSAEKVRIEKIKDPFKKIADQECDFGVSLKI